MKMKLLLMLVTAMIASGANAAVFFYDSFEEPVVEGYAEGTTPALWVRANQGYGSSRHGILNNAAAAYPTPYGNQSYAFRYTNSGITTAYGVIGALEAGTTYTISFEVGADQDLSKLPYTLQLMVFDNDTIARNDCRSTPTGAAVIETVSGSAPEDGSWANVTYEFTADAVDHAAHIGKDFALRFKGASTTANIDYLKVIVGGDQNPSPVDGATVPAGDVELSWTNNDPNNGNPFYIDVWYGTNPDALSLIIDGVEDANSVIVSAPVAGTYYWRVDTHTDGNPDGTPIVDLTYKFYVIDTDADGLPDEYELMYTDPPSGTALDPNSDVDSDGLTTWEEYKTTNTIPNNPDTDGDGLLDGPELDGVGSRPATDPLNPDTDGDGLADGVETNTGVWVDATDTGTNPVDLDWDKDGLLDGVETNTGVFVSASDTGTNPYSNNTDGDNALDWYEVAGSFTSPVDAADQPLIPYPLPDPDGSAGATNKPVKVYIMSGQSNMVGFGRINGSGPGYLNYMCNTESKFPNLVNESGDWIARGDVHYRGVISATGDDLLQPGFGASGDVIGPELGFGQVMGYYHDEPVLLIKSSIGNRSLVWDYCPPTSPQFVYGTKTYAGYGDSPASWDTGTSPDPISWYAGKQWDECFMDESEWAPAGAGAAAVTNVVDVLDNFATEYPQYAAQGFEIAGYVWWQGHKDQGQPYASKYEEYMVRFIEQIRAYYEGRYPNNTKPRAPFVLSTIGFGGWDLAGDGLAVAEAQLAVDGEAGNYPSFAGNVKTIESRGYWRDGSVSPSTTGYHYNHNAETYMLVGDALGRAMMQLEMGGKVIPGEDMVTWSGADFQLAPEFASDFAPVSFSWTANPADGVVFSPSADVEAPTVTITKATNNPSQVGLTLTATNSAGDSASGSMLVDVYDNACEAAKGKGLSDPADIAGVDCRVNLEDFAVIAEQWLNSSALAAPQAK